MVEPHSLNYDAANITGQRGGYGLWDPKRLWNSTLQNRVHVIYSDDNGQTWKGTGKPIAISDFEYDWINPYGRFIEKNDGTVIMTLYGCLSAEDTRERLDFCGLIRSSDEGESWGDVSIVAYDKENRWTAYNEMNIAPIDDEFWVAFIRTEYRSSDNGGGWMSRAVSTDGGHAWSDPELCTIGGAFGVDVLPDGGIVVGHSAGFHFTYDMGRTWSRLAAVPGYVDPILVDEDTILVGNMHGAFEGNNFGVWRRIRSGREKAKR